MARTSMARPKEPEQRDRKAHVMLGNPSRRPALVFILALLCSLRLFGSELQAQSWFPWGDQRPPVPREPVRPQPPPAQLPPPSMAPGPAPYSPSYGGQPPSAGQQSYGGRPPICVQLEQRLVAEGRGNSMSEVLPRIENDMRQTERGMREAQTQLERGNCYEYEFLFFAKSLKNNPQCRAAASQVETSKRRLAELDNQRQQIQQSGGRSLRADIVRELARNNCGNQYQQEASRNAGPFSSLWQDEDSNAGGTKFTYGSTFRTVCVRLCDGAFFPVSFSTLPTHFDRDQDVCQQKCAAPAELYYYSQTPGDGIEKAMSHKTRQPYTTLRTAFRYRKEFVSGCSCKQSEFLPPGAPTTATVPDRRADAPPAAGGPAQMSSSFQRSATPQSPQ